MAKIQLVYLLLISVFVMPSYSNFVERNYFARSMNSFWGAPHSSFLGNDDVQLVLDQYSGSGIQSKDTFLFGSVEMLIKLAPGNSAGTVTAYYLYSMGDNHDEIDFEFLGNVSGQPYVIHTNIFTGGAGGREQQFYPWFDPTADYHNYTIHWNPSEVVWYVDDIPIRVYKNYESEGIPYLKVQPMRLYASIWNADSWATRGGLDKIDWNEAPFVAKLRHFRARACSYHGTLSINYCSAPSSGNWWNSPVYSKLSNTKQEEIDWVRDTYMIYDYCKNITRYNGYLPGECLRSQY